MRALPLLTCITHLCVRARWDAPASALLLAAGPAPEVWQLQDDLVRSRHARVGRELASGQRLDEETIGGPRAERLGVRRERYVQVPKSARPARRTAAGQQCGLQLKGQFGG